MNPFLPQQAQAFVSQANQNLQNVLPQMRSDAAAAYGFGGSRRGIAEGLAIGNATQGLQNTLANLYGNAYESDANRGLQQQSINNQYALGQGNLNLGYGQLALGNRQADQNFQLGQGGLAQQAQSIANQYALGQGNLALGQTQAGNAYDLGLRNANTNQFQAQTARDLGYGNLGLNQDIATQNFYTAQRGQDLSQQQIGASLFGQGQQGLAQQGQGMYQAGLNDFNASYQPLASYANLLQPFTGLNNSAVNTQPGVSPGNGLLGGLLAGAQLGKLWGG